MSAFRLASDFNEADRIPERQIGSCSPASCIRSLAPAPQTQGASRLRSGGDDSKEAGLRRRPSLLANCHMPLWCGGSQLCCVFTQTISAPTWIELQTLSSHLGTGNALSSFAIHVLCRCGNVPKSRGISCLNGISDRW